MMMLAMLSRCDCFDLHQHIVPYADSWAWQRSVVTKRKELVDRNEDCSDTLIALQHSQVYTLGTASSLDYVHFNVQDPSFEIHRIDRAGEVTYHGPGQVL
jgi:lipoyl(octanoyl) transferase